MGHPITVIGHLVKLLPIIKHGEPFISSTKEVSLNKITSHQLSVAQHSLKTLIINTISEGIVPQRLLKSR